MPPTIHLSWRTVSWPPPPPYTRRLQADWFSRKNMTIGVILNESPLTPALRTLLSQSKEFLLPRCRIPTPPWTPSSDFMVLRRIPGFSAATCCNIGENGSGGREIRLGGNLEFDWVGVWRFFFSALVTNLSFGGGYSWPGMLATLVTSRWHRAAGW